MEKRVYIVLSYTGTILSRLVKIWTREKYSHVSISLDENLEQMYSFGRLYPYNPFIGRFLHEQRDKGTLKRFKKTTSVIYSLEVTDYQYRKMKKLIKNFEKNKDVYKFNIVGLFANMIHVKIKRKNHFYCAEFVKEVLNEADLGNDLPKLIKPIDFLDLDNLELVYEGYIHKYNNNV